MAGVGLGFALLPVALDVAPLVPVVAVGVLTGVGVGNAFLCVAALQHMVAHELIQPADLLDRDGLIEQIERLFGAQADNLTELAAVANKFVVDFDMCGA